MATTTAQLAELVGGLLRGRADTPISGAACLDEVQDGEITLLDHVERSDRLHQSSAAAAIVPEGTAESQIPTIVVDDVHRAFTAIVVHFRPRHPQVQVGISPAAYVSPKARLAKDVQVHAGASIDDKVIVGRGSTIHSGVHIMAGCRIGEHVTIMPGAVLYEDTLVGSGVIIHACAVIGAYGFGYKTVDGRHQRTAQLGHVEIGADVEIGAGSAIDRGTYGATVVGEGTKIDNLVMIAHNCRLGRHNLICSQVGIAGSTTTGDYVVLAGQVGVRDHVRIGHRAVLGAKAGISNDVPDDAHMIGIPATPEREQKLKLAALAKLPEMRQQLNKIRRVLDQHLRQEGPDDEQAAA